MHRFRISMFGIQLSATGMAGIAGCILLTTTILAFALLAGWA